LSNDLDLEILEYWASLVEISTCFGAS
jgi:hypothetical protein